MACDFDDECPFLVTDGTLSADSLYVKRVFTAGKIAEGDTVGEGITVAPVFVLTFHPIHELQTLALVVVSCCELDGEGVLVVSQLQIVRLVESLRQYYTLVVHVARHDLFLSDVELGEHHSRQGILVVRLFLHHPVHTIDAAKQHITVLFGDDGSGVELIALQTVCCGVVIKTVVVSTLFMVTLYDDTAHSAAGGYPDIVVLILCYTTDVIIAQSLFLSQVVQRVVFKIQNVQTFTRAYPDKPARVLKYLGDIVVGE